MALIVVKYCSFNCSCYSGINAYVENYFYKIIKFIRQHT